MTITHTASSGETYYPEMGGQASPTALFVSRCGAGRGIYLKWSANRHNEALAAFKANRITPRAMTAFDSNLTGQPLYSANVTIVAGRKLRAMCAHEILL